MSSRAGDTTAPPPPPTARKELVMPTNQTQPSKEATKADQLWKIHGKYYNLDDFIKSHPGGSAILEMSRGEPDVTPVFESYHAMANQEYILKTLEKYQVDEPVDVATFEQTEVTYTFEENGFYRTLTERVRAHFGAKGWNQSVGKNVKANKYWLAKVIVQSSIYLACWGAAFFAPIEDQRIAMALAFAAGVLLIGVGMNLMHDASHFAIGDRDSWKNKFALRTWNAIAFWSTNKWLYHHTVRHHSYTGSDKFDPDTVHAQPIVRKHPGTERTDYINNFPRLLGASRVFWSIYSVMTYGFFMYVTQIYEYHVLWPMFGKLWNMDYKTARAEFFEVKWWEYVLFAGWAAAHLYKMDILISLAYFLGSNLTYALCIVPDHDTHESAFDYHFDEGVCDWGEIQVRHASDFGGKGILGRAFTEFFGSINVQIAHHLYPGINHVYLPELVPIIKQTAEEFNVPYAHHGTIPQALWSFVKTVHRTMGEDFVDDVKKDE